MGDEGMVSFPVPQSSSEKDHSLNISVEFSNQAKATEEAVEAARDGGCVLWICDTVASAQTSFEPMRVFAADGTFDIGLLHSRFPFYRREELENHWMERLGKGERRGGGCILVSTQIVEQSVDLDADLMISELAPTDMLLQRLGRLWRHKRQNRPFRLHASFFLRKIAALKPSVPHRLPRSSRSSAAKHGSMRRISSYDHGKFSWGLEKAY